MENKEIFERIADFWEKQMPFNQVLGIKFTRFDDQMCQLQFDWNDKLIGNPMQKILHGGVTASVLDLVGGAVACANIIAQLDDHSIEAVSRAIGKAGTIDMRTDYLRPGRGKQFIATGHVIRSGNKVAVTRMELHNEKDEHIAFGTGTYMIG